MAFEGLTASQKKQLEFEVVSESARLRLTRFLRDKTSHDEGSIRIIYQNRIVNIARTILGLSIYVLEADADGEYNPAEYAWHNGEIELVMRRPNAVELVETIGDLIVDGALDIEEVNRILESENLSFAFEDHSSFDEKSIGVYVAPIDKIESTESKNEHINIRVLVERMDDALSRDDTSGVLHASASIFETLAKSIVGLKSVENQTLGSFFERYRKDSKLPPPILDYILDIYKLRNTEPLAGHGSLSVTSIKIEEAIILAEMTKAFIRAERKLVNMTASSNIMYHGKKSEKLEDDP